MESSSSFAALNNFSLLCAARPFADADAGKLLEMVSDPYDHEVDSLEN
jgi:hypothetical protein